MTPSSFHQEFGHIEEGRIGGLAQYSGIPEAEISVIIRRDFSRAKSSREHRWRPAHSSFCNDCHAGKLM